MTSSEFHSSNLFFLLLDVFNGQSVNFLGMFLAINLDGILYAYGLDLFSVFFGHGLIILTQKKQHHHQVLKALMGSFLYSLEGHRAVGALDHDFNAVIFLMVAHQLSDYGKPTFVARGWMLLAFVDLVLLHHVSHHFLKA